MHCCVIIPALKAAMESQPGEGGQARVPQVTPDWVRLPGYTYPALPTWVILAPYQPHPQPAGREPWGASEGQGVASMEPF